MKKDIRFRKLIFYISFDPDVFIIKFTLLPMQNVGSISTLPCP